MKCFQKYSAVAVLLFAAYPHAARAIADESSLRTVNATALRGKVMCGYQGWFRCPKDGSDLGWVHWSRDSQRLAADTLTFDLWPDMRDYSAEERFAVPGFLHADGKQAYLFSSHHRRTVLRHFEWLREYGIDGIWLQHFVVDLPGGTSADRYPSRRRVLDHVAEAAEATGRVWALTFDIAGMPGDRIFEVLTNDWKRLVDEKRVGGPRYLRQDDKPVVQIFGFYRGNETTAMTPALAERLIDYFKSPGPYSAFLVGGGDWDWRRNPDAAWQQFHKRFDAYAPWNIGNYTTDEEGAKHASTQTWAEDRRVCQQNGTLWIPTVYPGFGWDNLKRQPPGTTQIPRRGGKFLWEQLHALAKLETDTVFVAMFDEVDEGTAIFKVTSDLPQPGHFSGYEGLPSDWYLRLVGEGTRMLRKECRITAEIPLRP